MRPWFAPHQASYDREFIVWVLQHYLHSAWPRDPSDTSHDVNLDIQHQQTQKEANINWTLAKQTVLYRLSLCVAPDGFYDGAFTILYYVNGLDDGLQDAPYIRETTSDDGTLLKCIAQAARTTEFDIQRRVNRAINYVGWGNKPPQKARTPRGTYKEWCERKKRDNTEANKARWVN